MIALFDQPFNPWTQLQIHHASLLEQHGDCGAMTNFIGNMRDFNQAQHVKAMFLEHYTGMTEQYLETLLDKARQQWTLIDALIIHRVGHILPQETIVLVATWSQHRNEAFASCRFLLEELKFNAPFWKRETLATGEQRWVAENTPAGN